MVACCRKQSYSTTHYCTYKLEEIEEQDRRVSTLADDAKGSAKGNAIGQGHAASLDSYIQVVFCPPALCTYLILNRNSTLAAERLRKVVL